MARRRKIARLQDLKHGKTVFFFDLRYTTDKVMQGLVVGRPFWSRRNCRHEVFLWVGQDDARGRPTPSQVSLPVADILSTRTLYLTRRAAERAWNTRFQPLVHQIVNEADRERLMVADLRQIYHARAKLYRAGTVKELATWMDDVQADRIGFTFERPEGVYIGIMRKEAPYVRMEVLGVMTLDGFIEPYGEDEQTPLLDGLAYDTIQDRVVNLDITGLSPEGFLADKELVESLNTTMRISMIRV